MAVGSRPAFARVTHPSLVERIAADLREAILSGRLRPGDRLSDASIAVDMGVSRAPVREAIRQLAVRGLVEEEPRRGAFVARMTRRTAKSIYDCRRAIEGLAARRIATEQPADAARTLGEIVKDMAAAEREPLRVAEIDHLFHVTLCALTGNEWLLRLYEQLADQSRLMQALDSVFHAQAERGERVKLHEPIVEAIASGDPDCAEAAVIAHIDYSERLFLDEVPDIADEP
jgi:DNA-binding GntR family transcriptional regulator